MLDGVILVLGIFFPRWVLLFLWLLQYTRAGYESWVWPLLGFFFLPRTTLVYGLAHVSGDSQSGGWVILYLIAFLLDVLHAILVDAA